MGLPAGLRVTVGLEQHRPGGPKTEPRSPDESSVGLEESVCATGAPQGIARARGDRPMPAGPDMQNAM